MMRSQGCCRDALLFRVLASATLLTALGACAHQARALPNDSTGGPSVTGTVGYGGERIGLPSDAVVEISLRDATIGDSTAPALASTMVKSEGRQLPVPFVLRYDPRRIDKQHLYTMRAAITSNGQLLFTTDVARAVITQGNPTHVDLMLTRVDPDASIAPSDLVGTSWRLEDLAGAGVVEATHVTLDFTEKGKVTGDGSCNHYFATVEISGSSIRFGAVGSTRMACGTAVSLQEVRYFEALEAANRFVLDGRRLSIYSGGKDKPLRFTRAAP